MEKQKIKAIEIVRSPDVRATLKAISLGETREVNERQITMGAARAMAHSLKRTAGMTFSFRKVDARHYYITRLA